MIKKTVFNYYKIYRFTVESKWNKIIIFSEINKEKLITSDEF